MVSLLLLLVSSFLSEFCLYLPCLYDYPGKFPARSTAYAKARKRVCQNRVSLVSVKNSSIFIVVNIQFVGLKQPKLNRLEFFFS